MANNCLVTKLKGTVSNPNLPYYGQYEIDCRVSANSQLVNNITITTGDSTVYWTSEVDMYNAGPTVQSRVNLGRSGVFNPSSSPVTLYYDYPTKLKLHPIYDITAIGPHSNAAGQLNLNKLKLNQQNIKIYNYYGGGCYGNLADLDCNVELIHFGDFPTTLPVSLNMQGFNKVILPDDGTLVNVAWKQDSNDTTWESRFLKENIEQGLDLCKIFDVEGLAARLKTIDLSVDRKFNISNIELFNYSNCPNLTSFGMHEPLSFSGDFVNAFKDNPNFTGITFVLPTGSAAIELKPLFDGWKLAGKRDSTCVFYFRPGNYTINGVDPAPVSGTKNIVFDANGDWTIQ